MFACSPVAERNNETSTKKKLLLVTVNQGWISMFFFLINSFFWSSTYKKRLDVLDRWQDNRAILDSYDQLVYWRS